MFWAGSDYIVMVSIRSKARCCWGEAVVLIWNDAAWSLWSELAAGVRQVFRVMVARLSSRVLKL